MQVHLKPVTLKNWYDCTKLKVKNEQLNVFPAPVVYWIAESKYVNGFELLAVYTDTDEIVGFIVYCNIPDDDGNYWIPAFMVDEKHQGKGFGRAAMKKLIDHMDMLDFKRIMLGHRPDNFIAGAFYESLGFNRASEEFIDGEIVRYLQLS